MEKSLTQEPNADIINEKSVEHTTINTGIPTACREGFLNEDDKHTYNEHVNWLLGLQETGPIWSRLWHFNCMGQQRQLPVTKDKHYDIEIPKRLLSLWGNPTVQTELTKKLSNSSRYQMICCVLVCCACIKWNLDQWSSQMLDDIVKQSAQLYPELLRKQNVFQIQNLSHDLYKLNGLQFRAQLLQVATGSLYIPYGFHELNLARALMRFFRTYQFGLLHCHNRYLAFGFAVDMEYGFFMYDCLNKSHLLLGPNETNSYILRTNHLQILLYCMIVSLNVTNENEKFIIYNIDVHQREAAKDIEAKKPILKSSRNFNIVKRRDNRMKKAGTEKETCVPQKRAIGKRYTSQAAKSIPENKDMSLREKQQSSVENDQSENVSKGKPPKMHSAETLPNHHNFWNFKQSFPANQVF